MIVSIIHLTQGICNYILEKEVMKDGKIGSIRQVGASELKIGHFTCSEVF